MDGARSIGQIRDDLRATVDAMRAAFLAGPPPDLVARQARLRMLRRAVQARSRDLVRAARGERHPVHRGPVEATEWHESVAPAAYPVGVGPVLRVDTSQSVTDAQVCRLALAIRAAGTPTGSRYSAVI